MKAAVLERFKEDLLVREIPRPILGPNEVLLEVKAVGVCSTDLHLRDGANPEMVLPRVLGHEVAGEVVEIKAGKEPGNVSIGDRIVASIYVVCRNCVFCRTGRENLCVRAKRIGFELDGGYAEFVKIPYENALRIPDSLSFTEAAILPDAVAVMLHALRSKAQLTIGQSVMIQGIGGLGVHGIQIAKLCGASVLAVDVVEDRLEDAVEAGADFTINAAKDNVVKTARELTDGEGVDVVIEAVNMPYEQTANIPTRVMEDAIYSVKRGGKVIIVGYDIPDFRIEPRYIFMNELEIIGCRATTKAELERVIKLTKDRKIKPIVSQSFPLDDINKCLQELALGNVRGRAVVLP